MNHMWISRAVSCDRSPLTVGSKSIMENLDVTDDLSAAGGQLDYMGIRRPNFSEAEKLLLVEKFEEFRSILKSRSLGADISQKKQEVWVDIANCLNEHGSLSGANERAAPEVRKKWQNLLNAAKKDIKTAQSRGEDAISQLPYLTKKIYLLGCDARPKVDGNFSFSSSAIHSRHSDSSEHAEVDDDGVVGWQPQTLKRERMTSNGEENGEENRMSVTPAIVAHVEQTYADSPPPPTIDNSTQQLRSQTGTRPRSKCLGSIAEMQPYDVGRQAGEAASYHQDDFTNGLLSNHTISSGFRSGESTLESNTVRTSTDRKRKRTATPNEAWLRRQMHESYEDDSIQITNMLPSDDSQPRIDDERWQIEKQKLLIELKHTKRMCQLKEKKAAHELETARLQKEKAQIDVDMATQVVSQTNT